MKFFPRHSSCRMLLPVAVFGLLLSVATPVSWAQKDMGSIVGTVKDAPARWWQTPKLPSPT